MDSVMNFFFGNTLSVVLNLAIVAIFISALTDIVWRTIQLSAEEREFEKLKDFVAKENRKSIKKRFLEIIETLNPKTILARRLNQIYDVRSQDGKMNVEMVSHINENLPFPAAEYAKNIAGSLVLMGLMGTIVGLSVALGRMSSSITGFELEALKNRLNDILSGMNTAFSTSVTGLVLTLVVVVVIFWYNRRMFTISDAIDNFLATRLLPLIQPEAADVMQSLLAHVKENFESTKILADKLLHASGNAASQYDALLGVANSFENASQNIVSRYEETLNLQQETLGIAAEFKTIANGIQKNSEEFSQKYTTILQKLQNVAELNEAQKHQIDKLLESGEVSQTLSDRVLNQLEDNTTQFAATNGELKTVATELSTSTVSTTNRLVNLYEKTLSNLDASIRNSVDDQAAILHELTHRTQLVMIALKKESTTANEGLFKQFETFSNKLDEQNRRAHEEQVSVIKDLDGMIRNILQNLQATSDVIKKNTWGEPLHEDLVASTSELKGFGTTIQNFIYEVKTIVSSLERVDFRQTDATLRDTIDALTDLKETIRRRGILYRLRYLLSFIPIYRNHIDTKFVR